MSNSQGSANSKQTTCFRETRALIDKALREMGVTPAFPKFPVDRSAPSVPGASAQEAIREFTSNIATDHYRQCMARNGASR